MTPTTSSGSQGKAPSGYQQVTTQLMTPEQRTQLVDSLKRLGPGTAGGLDYLSAIARGDESAYADIEKPAYRAFEKTTGNLSRRFSQLGARNSSSFNQALGGAATELSENIASKRNDIRTQAIRDLLGHSNSLLGMRPEEQQLLQEDQSGTDWEGLLGQLGPAALTLLATILGGPGAGAATGVATGAASHAVRSNAPRNANNGGAAGGGRLS